VDAAYAATIVMLPVPGANKVQASELLNKITDSIETELTAIALAMETATDQCTPSSGDAEINTVIFTDCKTALSIIVWYGMVNVDFYSAIVTEVSNAE